MEPATDKVKAGGACKVKGFETCSAWVVSVGSKEVVEETEGEFINEQKKQPSKRLRETKEAPSTS